MGFNVGMGGGAQVRTVLHWYHGQPDTVLVDIPRKAGKSILDSSFFPPPHCLRPHPPCLSCSTGEVLSVDLSEADVNASRPGYRWPSLRSLFTNAIFRIYLATTAPSHVVTGGGVAGNAALAAVFAGMDIVAWWTLRRHAQAESSTTTF